MKRYDFYDEESGEPLLPEAEEHGRFAYFQEAQTQIHRLNNELTAVTLERDALDRKCAALALLLYGTPSESKPR